MRLVGGISALRVLPLLAKPLFERHLMHRVFLPRLDDASARLLAPFPPVKMVVRLLVTVVGKPSRARNESAPGNLRRLGSMKMVSLRKSIQMNRGIVSAAT